MLEVLLDPSLSLEDQVSATARSTYTHLQLVHQLQAFLDRDSWANDALLTSWLDYSNYPETALEDVAGAE